MSNDNEADDTTEYEDAETNGVEYEVERTVTRADGAAALRRLADGVANGSVELGDDDSVSATVPERFELEIEYEQTDGDVELEAELSWPIVDDEAVPVEGKTEPPERRGDADDIETGAASEVEEGIEEPVATPGEDVPIDAIVGAGDVASKARFELYRDRADEWRWRLVHDNGNIIADSGEGYDRKTTARTGMESVMRNAPGAGVAVIDE